jgi:uncharacterized protein YeaO (DUF488 family)
VYDPPDDEDGERFLVERLWPRGMGRSEARLTGWVKELAPSPALRKWFSHDPGRWAELAAKAGRGDITLVFAARDKERNSAVVLKRVLEN